MTGATVAIGKATLTAAIKDITQTIQLNSTSASDYSARAESGSIRGSPTKPSPTTTKQSGSTPKIHVRLLSAGVGFWSEKDRTKRQSPTTVKPFDSTPKMHPRAITVVSRGRRRANKTRRSPTTVRPFGSIPATSAHTSAEQEPGSKAANMTKASPTSTKPLSSTRSQPFISTTGSAHRPTKKELNRAIDDS